MSPAFDGDEGSVYDIQLLEAEAEASEIMHVSQCIMNAAENRPAIGLVMDAISGAFAMTDFRTIVDPDVFWDCISLMTEQSQLPTLFDRLKRYNVYLYSGRALFSALLPADFHYFKGDVRIVDGVLVTGRIKEAHIGTAQGSIVQILFQDPRYGGGMRTPIYDPDRGLVKYKPSRTAAFITDAAFVITRWLDSRELTIGPTDCRLEEGVSKNIRDTMAKLLTTDPNIKLRDAFLRLVKEQQSSVIQGAVSKVLEETPATILNQPIAKLIADEPNILLKDAVARIPIDNPDVLIKRELAKLKLEIESYGTKLEDPIQEAFREQRIIDHLKSFNNFSTKITVDNLPLESSLRVMLKDIGGGAKGDPWNAAQMDVIAGQQFYRNERPKRALTYGTRCLPSFPPNDESLEGNGFCINPLWKGLTPGEVFFLQLGGREGLMDQAINIAQVGYLTRKMTKALENVVTSYTGEVVNAVGNIFAFVYGGDGFDPAKLSNITNKLNETRATYFIASDMAARLNSEYGFMSRETYLEQTKEYQDPRNAEFLEWQNQQASLLDFTEEEAERIEEAFENIQLPSKKFNIEMKP